MTGVIDFAALEGQTAPPPSAAPIDFAALEKQGATQASTGNGPSGIIANLGAGLNQSLADTFGLPVDALTGTANLIERGLNAGARALGIGRQQTLSNLITGEQPPGIFQPIKNPIGGSESFKKLFGVIGANPDNVVAATPGEQAVRAVGQGIGSMVVPGIGAEAALGSQAAKALGPVSRGVLEGLRGGDAAPATNIAHNAVIGAASGAGQYVGEQAAPDGYKPLWGTAGALLFGGLPIGGKAAFDWAFSHPSTQSVAADSILKNASDPAAFRSSLDKPAPNLPGVEGTPGEISNDADVLQMQNWARNQNQAPFDLRHAANNQARIDALNTIAPAEGLSPGQMVTQHLAQLDAAQKAIEDAAATRATETRANLGGGDLEDIGATARGQIGANYAPRMAGAETADRMAQTNLSSQIDRLGGNLPTGEFDTQGQAYGDQLRQFVQEGRDARAAQENRLWAIARQNGDLLFDHAPTVEAVADARARINPAGGDQLTPAESRLYDLIESWNGPQDFDTIKSMRTNIGDATNTAFRSGDTQAGRRLLTVRNGLDASIDKAIDGRISAEKAAIEAGTLDPARSTEAALQRSFDFTTEKRDQWSNTGPPEQRSSAAVASGGANPGTAAGSGTSSVPGVGGAGSTTGEGVSFAGNVPPIPGASRDLAASGTPLQSGNYVTLDPSQLKVDPARFQYKASDENGVTGALRGTDRWEPMLANPITAWQDKAGQLWVANGHQRFDLATRAKAAGQNVQMPAQIYREADGYTPEFMRTLGAYQNIAEGSGLPASMHDALRAQIKEEGYGLATANRSTERLQPDQRNAVLPQGSGNRAVPGQSRYDAVSNSGSQRPDGTPRQGRLLERPVGISEDTDPLTPTSERYAASRAFTRETHAIFDDTPAGKVIARGPYGAPEKLPDSQVVRQFLNGKTTEPDAIRNFEAATGGRPEAIAALHDAAMGDLKQTALDAQTGRLKDTKLTGWLKAHDGLLSVYPELRQRIGNVTEAQRQLDDIQARRDDLTKQYQAAIGDSNATVMKRYFKSGPDGADAMDAYARETGNTAAARQAMADHIANSLEARFARTGWTDGGYKTWLSQHQAALSRRPDIAAKFDTAAKAQQALAAAQANRVAATKAFENGAAKHWLGTDPITAVTNALSTRAGNNPVQNIRDMMALAKGDDAAQAGIKRALRDWLVNKGVSGKEAGQTGTEWIKNQAMRDLIAKNRPALAQAFSPEEMKTLDLLASSLKESDRSITGSKSPIGPGTARDIAAEGRYGGNKAQTVLKMLGQGGLKLGMMAVGHHFAGVEGMMGSVFGSDIVHGLMNANSSPRREAIKQLMIEALADPHAMRTLLAHATPDGLETQTQNLARRMAQVTATASTRYVNGNSP